MTPKFDLGHVVSTVRVAQEVPRAEIISALRRHHSGDWGSLCSEDVQANDAALNDGTRILSAYATSVGKIWIITEADRSVTTILYPSEY